jgi:hypothetical protein
MRATLSTGEYAEMQFPSLPDWMCFKAQGSLPSTPSWAQALMSALTLKADVG